MMNRKMVIILGIILLGFTAAALGSGSDVKESRAIASGIGITLEALKGTENTELYIFYSDAALSSADRVKVSVYNVNGSKKYTEVYRVVAIRNGVSTIPLANLNQHETVEVEVTIGSGSSRVEMLGKTDVRLRPDLTIQSISAPSSALSTGYFNADITVVELNKDKGANFNVVIKEGSTILASGAGIIAPGGSVTVSLPLLINQAGLHDLSAIIENSTPSEYSTLNNEQRFSVKILQKPDLTIQSISAPATALNTSNFSVNLNIAELNKDTGASFIVVIKEGSTILSSGAASITAGGNTLISIPVRITEVGIHTLAAVIENSTPAEDNLENNRQDFSIEIQRPLSNPDLTIQSISAPATALNTSNFSVNLNIAELNKDTGANFTVVIKEGVNILASTSSTVSAGGNVSISLSLQINQVGIHNLSAVIEDSTPADDNTGNNQQDFNVEITKLSLNQADYTTMYYSQDDDYHNSKNLNSADGGGTHIEVSDYTEKRIVEKFYYKLTINKEIIFPVDSLHIHVSNDSGIVEEHEYANLKNKTVYYPDTESTLTITSAGGLTEIKLERSVKYQETVSSGYNYYSASDNTSWNSGSVDQKGVIMAPRIKTGVYIELIDDGAGYGGLGIMNLTAPAYLSSTWNNGGVTGYRNITTYYTKQEGKTSI